MVCIIQNGKKSYGNIYAIGGIVIMNDEEREISTVHVASDVLDARNMAIDELNENAHFDLVRLYRLDAYGNRSLVEKFVRKVSE